MKSSSIVKKLHELLPKERVLSRLIDVLSFASDAGFYHLVPKAVVRPVNEAEIIALFEFSHTHGVPVVFRTGGTSLSGQSVTDGILVDLSQFWNQLVIERSGELVRVKPGVTGATVNAVLKKFGRKIGPDPSSINAAMMGGILSNNSSGMCCGVALNSYHTTRYIRFILPDGKVFSTETESDYQRFEQECAALFSTLVSIRNDISANIILHDRIREKYKTKNTVGYSLNAFIDFEHPLDILAHLLIGAEGTLAFIAEAVMETVPDHPYKSTALLYFPDIYAACRAIQPLTDAGALMVELMDRASLHAVENMEGMPIEVFTLPDKAAALLVEFQEADVDTLAQKVNSFVAVAPNLDLYYPPAFTEDHDTREFLWKVRKGMFPAVGAVRASGTTVILEDIAFPVNKLGDAITDLQQLFTKHGYHNAIIFGHAKDGNIHFVITQSLENDSEINRYDGFMQEVVKLVIGKYDGTLKAEHGTGRNMAPFVETEWKGDAYTIMQQLKCAVDPTGLLNPGVIINENKNAHITHLKSLPAVEDEVDKCIECGYCEHKCPSRDITTTPRRRIVLRRSLEHLKNTHQRAAYKELLQQYKYDAMDTCAVDGLCATACPVDINTGDLIKRLRHENHTASANKVALLVAKQFRMVEAMARTGLKIVHGINTLFGAETVLKLSRIFRKFTRAVPLVSPQLGYPPSIPASATINNSAAARTGITVVYFPACISRLMGTYPGKQKNLLETFLSICHKTGIDVVIPERLKGSCCGQIFSSKGFREAYKFSANDIVTRLFEASREGALPIITDVSSCAYTLHNLRPALMEANRQKFDRLVILDSIDFVHETVLPLVTAPIRKSGIVLHPVCSLQKMKSTHKFNNIARFFASDVTIPLHSGCCGMAGDRGFLFPELTASATAPESSEVKANAYAGYYSSTRTCELAMSDAVQKNYESILYLVDEGIVNSYSSSNFFGCFRTK